MRRGSIWRIQIDGVRIRVLKGVKFGEFPSIGFGVALYERGVFGESPSMGFWLACRQREVLGGSILKVVRGLVMGQPLTGRGALSFKLSTAGDGDGYIREERNEPA